MQVVWDVTEAIATAAGRNILHRDVTPGNFGHVEGRGVLLDFSAGKVRWIVEWSRRVWSVESCRVWSVRRLVE